MKSPQVLSTKKSGKLALLPLAAVIFFTVSGGPYGIEPLIGYAGNLAIPLVLITPLLWDIPCILTVLELNSMMPVEGGYYQWVKRGLGLRWAFYEGWWTWLYTFVDLAIYPVFFVEYAAFFFPGVEAYKIPVCLAIIWINAALNIRGIVSVGRSAIFLTVLVMVPFFILLFTGVIHPVHAVVLHPGGPTGFSSFGMALYIIIWNYIGWDNASTYAGEVDRPVKSYLFSILIAFSAIYIIYVAVTWLALNSGIPGEIVSEKGIPYLGTVMGGQWLGAALSIGGMASMLGIFIVVLLSVSRVPAVMGSDKLVPKIFTRMHPRYQTPYISIIVCAGLVSFLILWPFSDLLVIDVSLYGAGIFLEFLALLRLRKTAALESRPFKIPLQRSGLILLFIAPLLVFSIALGAVLLGSGQGFKSGLFAIGAIFSAHIAWYVMGKLRNKKLG
ncbi:MAG: APC family permease [Bacteroidota bacterium]|nr:APC family permease [Bacteroidota bacterium]